MKNAYPEKPVLQYMRTRVEMAAVIMHLKSMDVPAVLKRAAYTFFRFESGNGRSGVNNNYTGVQCDGARWPAEYDSLIVGTVVKKENGTGNVRIYPAFARWQDSIYFTVTNAQRRGLYIGGKTWKYTNIKVRSVANLCTAYKREWVTGNPDYTPGEKEKEEFASVYRQAEKIFL